MPAMAIGSVATDRALGAASRLWCRKFSPDYSRYTPENLYEIRTAPPQLVGFITNLVARAQSVLNLSTMGVRIDDILF
jgi:hypothetical protein